MKGLKQLCLVLFGGAIGAMISIAILTNGHILSAAEKPAEAHAHDLTHYAAVAATCDHMGNNEYWECPQCNLYFGDAYGIHLITEADFNIDPVGHNVHFVAHQPATCTTAGNTQDHYACGTCGKLFDDAAAKKSLSKNAVLQPATGHNLTKVNAVAARCDQPGNVEYWACNDCHKNFDAGKNEIQEVATTVEHDLTHVAAVTATCTKDGNVAYDHCNMCGNNYDADMQILDTVVDESKGHQPSVYVSAVDATCEKAGRDGYYHCPFDDCDLKFVYIDETGAFKAVRDDELVIKALGHDYHYVKTANQATAYHDHVQYNKVCARCEKHDGVYEFTNYASYNKANSNVNVTASVESDENGDYDLFVVNAADLKHNSDGTYTAKIAIRVAGICDANSQYRYMDGEATGVNANTSGIMYLTVTLAELPEDATTLVWQFDWDGDGEYDQTIKVMIVNN